MGSVLSASLAQTGETSRAALRHTWAVWLPLQVASVWLFPAGTLWPALSVGVPERPT